MPKTVEEIKAEVTALVKSQGNQGAISLGTVLDDITELAGEGGGGGGGDALPKIVIKNPSSRDITVEKTADTKAIYDKCIEDGVVTFAIEIDMTGVAGLENILPMMPTEARAVTVSEGDVTYAMANFVVILPTSATEILAHVFTIGFTSDGTTETASVRYGYTIGA